MSTGQLPSPDDRWVEIVTHGVIPVGMRFLVVEELARMGDGWLLCWRDGIKPVHRGTLLHERHVKDCADESPRLPAHLGTGEPIELNKEKDDE